MKLKIVDKKGKKSDKEIKLSKGVWEVPMNTDLVAQYVTIYQDNQRKGTANTKTRTEVRGGGRKPWPQKGTGRARHGSIRSPLWVGGGITFGPIAYKKYKKMPKKMSRKALKCVLSGKAAAEEVLVLEEFPGDDKSKTSDVVKFVEKLGLVDNKILLVIDSKNQKKENMLRVIRNLENIQLREAVNLNVYDVMNSNKVVLIPEAVKELEERLK